MIHQDSHTCADAHWSEPPVNETLHCYVCAVIFVQQMAGMLTQFFAGFREMGVGAWAFDQGDSEAPVLTHERVWLRPVV